MALGDRTFRQLNLDHPEVESRIMDEIGSDVDVYYDRRWPFTREFCGFLMEHPELVAGRRVLVVGAGVGMEAVVAGHLAQGLWINDLAPVALELQQRQLAANGLTEIGVIPGSFGELELPPEVDLVLGCFVIYDPPTAEAMEVLVTRSHGRGIPTLLADLDMGKHFSDMISRLAAPVRRIASWKMPQAASTSIQVVQVG